MFADKLIIQNSFTLRFFTKFETSRCHGMVWYGKCRFI